MRDAHRTIWMLVIILLSSHLSHAQETVEDIVKEGIKLHDEGRYDDAIKMYQKALEIDDASGLVNFEIALTYMYDHQFEKSLEHGRKAVDSGEKNILGSAYTIVGNCLDELGKREEAISTYEEALKVLGDDHMVYYNMGLTYNNMGKSELAMETLIKGISINSGHASSHLLLGDIMKDLKQKSKSLLSLYYFLMLEPTTDRSFDALESVYVQLYGPRDRSAEDANNILIDAASLDKKDPLSSVNLLIAMMNATNNLPENQGKGKKELFVENTDTYFTVCGELRKKKFKGLYWEFYIDFFYKLAKSKHIEAFCYFVSQSERESIEWVESNPGKVDALIDWVNNYYE